MTTRYLRFEDPDSTLGMTPREPEPKYGMVHECPVCHGYGGWHLLVDADGAGKHFNCSCSQCAGWGWVTEADATCIHDMEHTRKLGNCWNLYTCTKCGRKREIDSSG